MQNLCLNYVCMLFFPKLKKNQQQTKSMSGTVIVEDIAIWGFALQQEFEKYFCLSG